MSYRFAHLIRKAMDLQLLAAQRSWDHDLTLETALDLAHEDALQAKKIAANDAEKALAEGLLASIVRVRDTPHFPMRYLCPNEDPVNSKLG